MGRILIISDNDFRRDMIRHALAGIPAEIHCTREAGPARELCRRTAFDLVIALSAAPFRSGCLEFGELHPAGTRRPKVYVITWQQSEQTALSLFESGVDQYMTFPVNLRRLKNKVSNDLNAAV